MGIKAPVIAAVSILALSSCTSVVGPPPASRPILLVTSTPPQTIVPNHPTNTPPPRPVPVSTVNGIPVFEINEFTVEREYCNPPEVILSPAEAEGLDNDGIVRRLMELWLDYFNAPQAPDYCRIDDYVIDRIYYDERTPFLHLEPSSNLMRTVQFSIKLVQYPTFWAPWSGEIDEQNWLHTGVTVAVFRAAEGYTMKFARP